PVQQANRVFSVVARVQEKNIQHNLFGFPCGLMVALVDCPEVVPLRFAAQTHPPQKASESGYFLSVPTASPPVTFCMARYGGLRRATASSYNQSVMLTACDAAEEFQFASFLFTRGRVPAALPGLPKYDVPPALPGQSAIASASQPVRAINSFPPP